MIKKKVFVHGSLKSLNEFFNSPFSLEFEPSAILTDEPEKVTVIARNPARGGVSLEVFATENLPRFALNFIDGIVLTDFENRNETFNRLIQMDVDPRKIILWNNRGIIEPLTFQADDGSSVVFMEGLQFHIRNQDDANFVGQMRANFQIQRQFYSINPAQYREYVSLMYRQRMGKNLDWNNLQTWTEKMQWLKLYDSTPLKTRLADKYLVRQWIAEKIGAEYLIPLLGVWNNFDEIDFDTLPNQFVLKCNHGSGMNIICRDKNSFDFERAREKLTAWLNWDFGTMLFEPHYFKISRKIIAEKFMTDGKNFDLTDYKFLCFNGKVIYCQYLTNRSAHLTLDYFDMNWNHLNFERSDHTRSKTMQHFPKPKNFELMKKLAAELCKDFSHVRVDFYEIDDKVYFGKMTFTPAAAYIKWNSEGTDELFGELMTLDKRNYSVSYVNPYDFELNYSARQKILPTKNILRRKTPQIGQRVIASLTSWKKRIATVHLAIQTILAQTRQPDLTVLYLSDREFPNRERDLPRELTALLSKKFEIRWTKDIKSYKKLIPALKDFPDDVIITFDDDVFYDRRSVEILLKEYSENPHYIHCHRASHISLNENKEVSTETFSNVPLDKPSYLNRFTGVGGVLYPPHCLYDEVLREEKFMTLAPTNDDIWFSMMATMNGYRINCVRNNLDTLNYIPGTQTKGVALWLNNNEGEKLFFVHLKNILDAYPVLKDILESEWRRVVR